MKKRRSGWLYSWKALSWAETEHGAIHINAQIFFRKKDLIARFGNEWGRLATKVRITIKEAVHDEG